jgi:hypothetical protein
MVLATALFFAGLAAASPFFLGPPEFTTAPHFTTQQGPGGQCNIDSSSLQAISMAYGFEVTGSITFSGVPISGCGFQWIVDRPLAANSGNLVAYSFLDGTFDATNRDEGISAISAVVEILGTVNAGQNAEALIAKWGPLTGEPFSASTQFDLYMHYLDGELLQQRVEGSISFTGTPTGTITLHFGSSVMTALAPEGVDPNVPEPRTVLLLGSGLAAAWIRRLLRRAG